MLDAHVGYRYLRDSKLENKDLDWVYVLDISYWIVIPLLILTVLSIVSGSLITEVSY